MLLLRLATRLPRCPTRPSRNVAGPVGYIAFLGWKEFVPPRQLKAFASVAMKTPSAGRNICCSLGSARILKGSQGAVSSTVTSRPNNNLGQRPNTDKEPRCYRVHRNLRAKQQSRLRHLRRAPRITHHSRHDELKKFAHTGPGVRTAAL